MFSGLQEFIDLASCYLAEERQAELEEAREYNPPPSLSELKIVETTPGFRANETLLALTPCNGGVFNFDASELTCGDVVEITLKKLSKERVEGTAAEASLRYYDNRGSRPSKSQRRASKSLKGTVWRISHKILTMAVTGFDDYNEEFINAILEETLCLIRLFSSETYSRMNKSLERMKGLERGDNLVADILFGSRKPSRDSLILDKLGAVLREKHAQSKFNEHQIVAIENAVSSNELALIHGPPGTGKTCSLVEGIYQSVRLRNERILVTAPSNIATDHLVETLLKMRSRELRIVRVGNPVRLSPSIMERSLDSLVENNFRGVGRDIRKDMSTLQRQLRGRGHTREERRQIRNGLRELFKELRRRERNTTKFVLSQANVVVATCAGAADKVLTEEKFDAVFIDESAQALEPLAWIGILRSGRCVLAGDNKQLSPVIRSNFGVDLSRKSALTIFDRAQRVLEDEFQVLLRKQYRMHHIICQWSSEFMYRSSLETDSSVANILPQDLSLLNGASALFPSDLSSPMIFIDTAGCDFEESEEEGHHHISQWRRPSKLNEGEARIVVAHVKSLVSAGLAEKSISVIAPYSAQVRKLRALLPNTVEVATVDGFQGRESEIVVVSLVRSNTRKEVGFVADSRRLNVAITRAKRQICIVGDSTTITTSPALRNLVKYIEKRTLGDYRSAWSYA